ncbi:MAG: hypothetical protein ABW321_10865 [Polyangiales bacterium]
MTCIVAVKVEQNGAARIVMGGDSAGVSGLDINIRKDPKVFRKGDFVIGFTTSFRMGQIIRFKFTPPAVPAEMDLYEYMVTHFVDEIRAALKQGGFAEVSNGVERGGSFMVALRDRLFTIQSDFQVAETHDDFAAIGCGADYALGALAVLHQRPISGEEMARHALEVATHFSGGVRGPFSVLATDGPLPTRDLREAPALASLPLPAAPTLVAVPPLSNPPAQEAQANAEAGDNDTVTPS